MRYKIIPSKRFEKDMKRCKKRGYNMQLIKDAIMLLAPLLFAAWLTRAAGHNYKLFTLNCKLILTPPQRGI